MIFTFAGGASEVGASCTILDISGRQILIDGGMRPAAREGQSRIPDLTLLKSKQPEAIVLTHAHIDHTGALPLIASLYPHVPVYATESTRVLTEILLKDSVRIMEEEGLKPDGETPLYSAEQVDTLLARITPMAFHQPFAPIPSFPTFTVRYLPAGHILGAAMLFFETPEGTILHTGDISVTDQRTIKGLDIEHLPQADLVISEGTYGNRSHSSRKEEERKLAETVQGVLSRGGRIILPAFAVGRAQEIILVLKAYRASGQISPVPIYLDGMVRTVCMAYQNQSHDLHPSLQRFLINARRPLFADPDLQIFAVRALDRAMLVKRNSPTIVISSSGMLSGGASPLYAADMATDERNAIIFSGYQDEESPGAALLRAKTGETLRLGADMIQLNCQIARYNLSGHADADQIVHVVTKIAPKRLILVHGAPDSLDALARRFPKIQVDIPTVGDSVVIEPGHSSRSAEPSAPVIPSQRERGAEAHNHSLASSGAPPTIIDLWNGARQAGPTRPWTAVELGQRYYGTAYRPALRTQVEEVLKNASPYFKQGRVGAQPTYLPRSEQESQRLQPLTELSPGAIVLVQGQKATAQIALVLSPPKEGMVSLVADQWKVGRRPMNLIQLVPGIRREEWLSFEDARHLLHTLHQAVSQEWVDLFALWEQYQGRSFTFADVCRLDHTEEQRLAWGLDLLTHGHELFQRDGSTWASLPEQRIAQNVGFVRHLTLLDAGKQAGVLVNGRQGTLTGRSSWRYFEVRWLDGDEVGECTKVRSQHLQLV